MKFQTECAQAFNKSVALDLISKEHCKTIMKIAWDYIKNNIEVAVEEEQTNESCVSVQYVRAWMDLFVELSTRVDKSTLTQIVIPTIKSLIDLKRKIPIRKYAVDLIVKLTLRFEEPDILAYTQGLILYWWQDLNWNIRLAICEQLSKVCAKLSKENILEIIYPEIVEFLNDVEILVRLTAIECALEIFDVLEEEHVDNDFIPVVKMHLNLDLDETCNYRMSKNIGKIVFNLQNSLDDSSGINELWIDYFQQLLEMDNPDIRLNLCYNIPGLYYVFNSEENLDFISILEKFASDKDQTIRHQFAKCFHEIVSINSKGKGDSVELKHIFFTLLTDDDPDIQKVIIKNLDEYLMNFFRFDEKDLTPNSRDSTGTDDVNERSKSEFFNECIEHLLHVADNMAIRNPNIPKQKIKGANNLIPLKESSWRTKQVFYQKLISLFDLFQQDHMKAAFWDAAKEDFYHGTEPLRKTWAIFLAKVMNSECLQEDRQELLDCIVEDLQNGNFSQRKCLLEFYEYSLEVFTKTFWLKHWYKDFIKFASDKIPVLRIRFAKSAMRIWQNLTKHDTEFEFMDWVETLLDDLSEDVQEVGVQLNSLIIKGYDSSREHQLEEEEKNKINYERVLRDREKREREEIQRKKEEEREKKEYMEMLTDQMRMKKRYLKLPGFQAKLFTKETSHSKGRSRKRGSFTVGSRSKTSKSGSGKKITSANSTGKIGSSTPNHQTRGLSLTNNS